MSKQDCVDIINLVLMLHNKYLPEVVVSDLAAALVDAANQAVLAST